MKILFNKLPLVLVLRVFAILLMLLSSIHITEILFINYSGNVSELGVDGKMRSFPNNILDYLPALLILVQDFCIFLGLLGLAQIIENTESKKNDRN